MLHSTPHIRLFLPALVLACLAVLGAPRAMGTGLDAIPPNTTCVAGARPDANPNLRVDLEVFAQGLDFPTNMVQSPVDPTLWYVSEREGFIRRVQNGSVVGTALDISGVVHDSAEGGFLGLALHPDFDQNGEIFVYYSEVFWFPPSKVRSVVSRFTSGDGGLTFPPASEEVLFALPQPNYQHLAGDVQFGPDGYLYITLGDNLTVASAQDTFDPRGSVLRIDVDGGVPYAIPPDNPFAVSGGAPEVWAYGFRNPYRMGFDPVTGDLYLGDVGLGSMEEVDLVAKQGNYGWGIYEGSLCVIEPCDPTGLTFPAYEYPHSTGCAVLGGRVYQGPAIPDLQGGVLFGDFCTNAISAGFPDGGGGLDVSPLLSAPIQIYGFGQDADGEVYVLDDISIRKLVPKTTPPPPPIATLLSQTGCVDPLDPTNPAPGVLRYDVNVKLYSDDAVKERWLALPPGGQVKIRNTGDTNLPVGAVAVKNFDLQGQRVETRLFMRHDDGGWAGYSYEWNAQGTDATLLDDTKQTDWGGQTWTYPSPEQCLTCHTFAAGYTLGLETLQLNGDFFYEETGRTANQLETLEHLGLLVDPLSQPTGQLEAFRHQSLDEEARAYLHANCSGCHRAQGGGGGMKLDYWASTFFSGTCDVQPIHGNLGVEGAKRIAPGYPELSVISLRMNSVDPAVRMPPLGRSLVDPYGAALIDEWILTWPSCALGPDSDADGEPDATDNCVQTANPAQTDTDMNGVGDDCQSACSDGIDNDGDGLTDYPEDPGCEPFGIEDPACADGIDNDGDGATDAPWDLGCRNQQARQESRSCEDGLDNDQDGVADWAGVSGLGLAPDPECEGRPFRNERGCGLGAELVLLVLLKPFVLRRRRGR